MRQTVTKSISVSVCVCITVCLCVCIYVCLCVFISVCLYICGVLEVLTQTGAQKPLKAAGCIVRSLLTYLCLRSLLLCHRPHLCLLFVCAIAACHLEATKALWSVHTLHQRVYSTPPSVHQKVPAHQNFTPSLRSVHNSDQSVSCTKMCQHTSLCFAPVSGETQSTRLPGETQGWYCQHTSFVISSYILCQYCSIQQNTIVPELFDQFAPGKALLSTEMHSSVRWRFTSLVQWCIGCSSTTTYIIAFQSGVVNFKAVYACITKLRCCCHYSEHAWKLALWHWQQ